MSFRLRLTVVRSILDRSALTLPDSTWYFAHRKDEYFLHIKTRHGIISQNEKGDKHMSGLLTVAEVARSLRVDDTTVRRWIKQGVLEAISLPHRHKRQAYHVHQETLDSLLAAK